MHIQYHRPRQVQHHWVWWTQLLLLKDQRLALKYQPPPWVLLYEEKVRGLQWQVQEKLIICIILVCRSIKVTSSVNNNWWKSMVFNIIQTNPKLHFPLQVLHLCVLWLESVPSEIKFLAYIKGKSFPWLAKIPNIRNGTHVYNWKSVSWFPPVHSCCSKPSTFNH